MNNYPHLSEGILGEQNTAQTNKELFLSLVGQYFPEAVKDGEIDFNALKEEMGGFAEVGSEHYAFTWAGKQAAKKEAQADLFGKTLRFKPQDSVNPDTTENIYIEGDNLEALKLLRRNYHGKIKMIYIDPPYNTGNDFVYHDDFSMTEEELDELSGNIVDGVRYQKNTKDSSRYHTNWLNMMYPRLKLARELLSDDGVIFISIDDNEQDNLKKICDEIFGENNCIGPIIQNKQNAKNDTINIQRNHEFILVYRKMALLSGSSVIPTLSRKQVTYKEAYEENGEYYYLNDPITTRGEGGTLNARPNLGYTVYYNPDTKDKIAIQDYDVALAKMSNNDEEIYCTDIKLINNGYVPIRPPKVRGKLGCWTWGIDKFNENKKQIIITGKPNAYSVRKRTFVDKANIELIDGKLQFEVITSTNSRSILDFSTNEGTNSLTGLLEANVFSNPKNVEMIQYFIDLIPFNDFIVLDFFSGSATTAHAVFAHNFQQVFEEKPGKVKFILVQLPEPCDEKSEAYKAGYTNICEIGKERIRRAGEHEYLNVRAVAGSSLRWNDERKAELGDRYVCPDDVDIGFKVFEIGSTTIRWNTMNDEAFKEISDADYSKGDRDNLDFMPNSSDLDIVYEIMLRQYGIPLSTPIEKMSEISERTYCFADAVVVCLEAEMNDTLIERLANIEPTPAKFVLRDSAFGDDIELKDVSFRKLSALIRNHQTEEERKSKYNNYTVEFI